MRQAPLVGSGGAWLYEARGRVTRSPGRDTIPPGLARALRIPLYALYLVLIAELACRAFWRIEYEVPPFGATEHEWYGIFFEGFRPSAVESPPTDADALEVLLLGGSVLYGLWVESGAELKARLEAATGHPVHITNHSASGHTTRDSLLKYQLLEQRHFDLVIIYHGINDARMNNVPAERFRADYSHAAWYDQLRVLERDRPWEAVSKLPFGLRFLAIELADSRYLDRYVPRHRPREGWTAHGAELKSEVSFAANLTALVELARARGEPVLLMTFAWYTPQDYSLEKFRAKQLDYADHDWPLEHWGRPEHVMAALRAHNAIIERFRGAPGVVFVDVAARMPHGAAQFHDVCHLTVAGQRRWMQAFVPAAAAALRR